MKLDNESRINLLEQRLEEAIHRINELEDEREDILNAIEGFKTLWSAIREIQDMHEAPASKFMHYNGNGSWWK